jgi:hypothetical protein
MCTLVIASEAKQSRAAQDNPGLPRFARNDDVVQTKIIML